MPTFAPDHTPSDVACAARQGQPAPVSPALAHQLSLAEFAALKTQLAAQAAEIATLKSQLATSEAGTAALKSAIPQSDAPPVHSVHNVHPVHPVNPNLQSSIFNLQSAIRHSK